MCYITYKTYLELLKYTWRLVTTPDAPRHNPRLVILVNAPHDRTHQRRATIALARVLAAYTASAHETAVQLKMDAHACLAQFRLANIPIHYGQLNPLQYHLIPTLSAEQIFAPARRKASAARIERRVLGRQTRRIHIVGQHNGLLEKE